MPDPAPLDFTLRDLSGKSVRLADWRGHPVIVDFWATWCAPCRKQIPELKKIYRRHRSRGLVVIGVSCDTIQGEGVKAIPPFVKEFAIDYPILVGDEAVTSRLGVRGIPTTLFVDRDGRLLEEMVGAGHTGELSQAAERLLKSPATAKTSGPLPPGVR